MKSSTRIPEVGASDAPDCIAFKPEKPEVNKRKNVTASMRFTITNLPNDTSKSRAKMERLGKELGPMHRTVAIGDTRVECE